VALVTADLEDHVVAVDLASGQVRRRIATLPGPRAIERIHLVGAVAVHTSEGAVSILDASDLSVRRVVRGFGEPRYAATTWRYAYVTDSARGEVAVVDLVRAKVDRRIDVGGPARHVTLSPGGRRLWTALGNSAEQVAVLDLTTPIPRLVRKIEPPFLAHDVAFTPTGLRVWVTSGDRRTLGVYDARTLELVYLRPAGAAPQHVTFVDRKAYVTSGDDGTLNVHRLPDGAALGTTRVPPGSFNVDAFFQRWGPAVVLTPSLTRGTLCVLGLQGRVRMHRQVARSSHDACFLVTS
jgi:DNA-binding beta-propeller fold protein YncE